MTAPISELILIRNKHQPHSTSNLDPIQYDYLFWTDLEKKAKKHRAKALEVLKSASKTPDKPGVIMSGNVFETTLKQTAPYKAFDKEVFIDLLLEKYPDIPRHVVRELTTAAVVDGDSRKTYTTQYKETDA